MWIAYDGKKSLYRYSPEQHRKKWASQQKRQVCFFNPRQLYGNIISNSMYNNIFTISVSHKNCTKLSAEKKNEKVSERARCRQAKRVEHKKELKRMAVEWAGFDAVVYVDAVYSPYHHVLLSYSLQFINANVYDAFALKISRAKQRERHNVICDCEPTARERVFSCSNS